MTGKTEVIVADVSRCDAFVLLGTTGAAVSAAHGEWLKPRSVLRGGMMMSSRPVVIAFDVIETLFALEPLADRLRAVGLPPDSLRGFFAGMLRDAFALEASGVYRPFREVASASLEVMMANAGVTPEQDKLASVLEGFAELPPHPDVRPAFEYVRSAGIPIITLTNGSAQNTRQLLSAAGILEFVEKTISVDEVRHWKPHREVYLYAARAVGIEPSRLGLVAAHAWDTHGATQAGLVTGWVQRQDKRVLSVVSPPDVRGETLLEVAEKLLSLPVDIKEA
jgi:2-haloacid dehalogenase